MGTYRSSNNKIYSKIFKILLFVYLLPTIKNKYNLYSFLTNSLERKGEKYIFLKKNKKCKKMFIPLNQFFRTFF